MKQGQLIRRLKGHSGCEVGLFRAGDTYFVRKRSGSASYNERLAAQIEKQQRLANRIRVPKILETGMEDGLVYCDMEYVAGTDFASFILQTDMRSLAGLARTILSAVAPFEQDAAGVIAEDVVNGKVADVIAAVRDHPLFAAHADFLPDLSARLAAFDWSGIPLTDCHGDLTVENMLFGDAGEVVFIDLLDGPLQSVWLDVAKLIQDLASGWSVRAHLWQNPISRDGRLIQMLTGYLYEETLLNVDAIFPGVGDRLTMLRALQAMRVLPYVQEPATFARVVDGLKLL